VKQFVQQKRIEGKIRGKIKGRLRRMWFDDVKEWTIVKDYEEVKMENVENCDARRTRYPNIINLLLIRR